METSQVLLGLVCFSLRIEFLSKVLSTYLLTYPTYHRVNTANFLAF